MVQPTLVSRPSGVEVHPPEVSSRPTPAKRPALSRMQSSNPPPPAIDFENAPAGENPLGLALYA